MLLIPSPRRHRLLLTSRHSLYGLGIVAALLLLVAVVVAWPSSPEVEAQTATGLTAPVNDADRVFTQLSVAELAACGVTRAGYIRCWGNTLHNPVRSDTNDYVEVAATSRFTCGRRSNGVVDCWAALFDFSPIPPSVLAGDRVGEPVTFSAIAASPFHVCGILDGQHGQTAGLLQCWPSHIAGDRGVNLATVPSELAGVTVSTVAASFTSTCVLVKGGTDDGKAKCWGEDGIITFVTELGLGDATSLESVNSAAEALSNKAFSDIAASNTATCGIVRGGTETGEIKCWGLVTLYDVINGAPTDGTFRALDMGGNTPAP